MEYISEDSPLKSQKSVCTKSERPHLSYRLLPAQKLLPESSLSGDIVHFQQNSQKSFQVRHIHTLTHTPLSLWFWSFETEEAAVFGSNGISTPRRNWSSTLEFQLCPLIEDTGMKIASPTQQTVVMAPSSTSAVMGVREGCSNGADELRACAESSTPRCSLKLPSLTLLPQTRHFSLL